MLRALRLFLWRIRRFGAFGWRRRALLVEASLWLLLARVALLVFPFRRIAARLGELTRPADLAALTVASERRDPALAAEIGWAVTRAAAHVPFRAVCLPQAMAARVMLARRGVASVLHFGAAMGDNALDAHAWLDSSGVEVTGYPIEPRFRELAAFV